MLERPLKDLKTIYQIAFRPIKGGDHKARLESFYSGQSALYDDFRKRLLPGREMMAEQLPFQPGQTWLDFGGGTGSNLDFVAEKISQLKQYTIVDLSHSLLAEAQKKVNSRQLKNVECIEADVTEYRTDELVDGIIFSYSLTMIPNWFLAIENALKLLKPGGTIAVVDFFVARKYPDQTSWHNWWTRSFWPLWFAHDGVYLSSEHVPYLKNKLSTKFYLDGQKSVPYVPLGKVPYYIFIGEKTETSH